MNVDVLAGKDRRLDAIGRRPRLDEAHRRLDRFLHHLAKLAGGLDLTLAWHRHRFDRQQFAADLSPREPGDRADLVLLFAHPVAEFADAKEFTEVFGRQLYLLHLAFEDLAQRLAGDLGKFALHRADAGFARVMADHPAQRVVAER